ncbi:MAG: hypothetical protein ACXACK_12910 [Candidatus Hodarchaeales archaeon]
MKKETMWQISFGILFFLIPLFILMSNFWSIIFEPFVLTLDSMIYLILITIITCLSISFAIWRIKSFNHSNNVKDNQFRQLNMKIGSCLGSITDTGSEIFWKSDFCPFKEQYLRSMLEHSFILFKHGEIGNIYGPSPMTRRETDNDIEGITPRDVSFVSYGFQAQKTNLRTLGEFNSVNSILAILILYFPKTIDYRIMKRKKLIVGLIKSVIGTNPNILDLIPDKMVRIENEIQLISLF